MCRHRAIEQHLAGRRAKTASRATETVMRLRGELMDERPAVRLEAVRMHIDISRQSHRSQPRDYRTGDQ